MFCKKWKKKYFDLKEAFIRLYEIEDKWFNKALRYQNRALEAERELKTYKKELGKVPSFIKLLFGIRK